MANVKKYEWEGKIPAIVEIDKVKDFLCKVHPHLIEREEGFKKSALELRTVARATGAYKRAKLFWNLKTEKDLFEFEKYIKNISGTANCTYFSLFAQDTDKRAKTNCTNNENAMYTSILPIDLDNISEKQFNNIENKIALTGLEYIVVASGHGYQVLFLLDKPCYNKEILEEWIDLLFKKGIDCDGSIVDSARVFRLPYTYNCKGFSKSSKYFGEAPIQTFIKKDTNMRYKVEDIFYRIEKNILDNPLEKKRNNTNKSVSSRASKIKKDKKEVQDIIKQPKIKLKDKLKLRDIASMYKYIKFSELDYPIQKMLQDTPEGYRNSTCLFLVPFLKELGVSVNNIIDTVLTWNKVACEITEEDEEFLKSEVRRMLKYKPKYTSELEKVFGKLNPTEKYVRKNMIKVRGNIFKKYTQISEGALRIYISMLISSHLEKKIQFTKEEILEAADISKNTFTRNIDDLLKNGFIDKKRSRKKLNEKYKYTLNRFLLNDEGMTLFEVGTLENMIFHKKKALTAGEMKVYMYLCYMINGNDECYASQEYIASKTGYARNSISRITTCLQEKKYIIKETTFEGKKTHCIYTLKY